MGTVGRGWSRVGLFLLVIGAGLIAARLTGLLDLVADPAARLRSVHLLRSMAGRWWVGPVFALVYAVAVGCALPASLLTLVGGAAFGWARGALWVTVGANLGATLGFWLARGLGRSALESFFGTRLGKFDTIAGAAGFHGLLMLRLLPLVPFSLLNFVAGLTTIPWRDYAAATVIGILPGTVIYVAFADAILAGTAGAGRAALIQAGVAGLLLVAVTLVVRSIRRRPAGEP